MDRRKSGALIGWSKGFGSDSRKDFLSQLCRGQWAGIAGLLDSGTYPGEILQLLPARWTPL
jgi:hypothetical protein